MKEKLLEELTRWQENKNFPISDDDLGEIIEIASNIVQSERDKDIIEMMNKLDTVDIKDQTGRIVKEQLISKDSLIKLINNK